MEYSTPGAGIFSPWGQALWHLFKRWGWDSHGAPDLETQSRFLAHCNLFYSTAFKMHECHCYLYVAKIIEADELKSYHQDTAFFFFLSLFFLFFFYVSFIYLVYCFCSIGFALTNFSPIWWGGWWRLVCTDLLPQISFARFPSSNASSSAGCDFPTIQVKASSVSPASCNLGGLMPNWSWP